MSQPEGGGTPGSPAGAAVRTFLFVDIRGYTRFVVEHGDAAALRLIEKFESVTRRVLSARHGEIIGKAGDEAVAVFGSAREALQAALDLQASVEQEGKGDPSLPPVGIGLDTGEAVPSGDTYIGASLNLAARLCKLAGPREVLASEVLVHVAGKIDGIAYTERGFAQLKGFQQPVHVFQVVSARLGTETEPPSEGEVGFGPGVAGPLPIGAFLGALPSTELVARDAELQRVLAAADATAAGSGRLVLLAGEPGVGKTRLAQEAMLTVRNRRFLVAAGRCYEQHQPVPYYPFLDVLSGIYAAASQAVRAAIPGRWPHLYLLLPDLRSESLPPVTGTPEEQQRLFRAVTGFLQAVAAEQPVGIFLDDLHATDEASVALLQHLARHVRGDRILMVGTYRDRELGRHHPLEAALRDLAREDLVDRIPLRRFGPDGTSKLIAMTLGDRSVPRDFVAMIHEQAEGNPFFTQQLVRFLVERGDLYRSDGRWVQKSLTNVEVPESVRSVIGQRTGRLSDKTQDLLRESSVLGQTFSFETLVALSGRTEAEIEEALEEAQRAGLVGETDHDQYAFDNALTHQTLYAELPARKRRRLHLAAAEALERLPESSRTRRSAQLAWHFLEADQKERAIPYAIAAGDHAASVFAYREAEKQYSAALELAEQVGNRDGEVGALIRRAKLRREMFQGKPASTDYERLLELARRGADPRLELEARLGLMGAYYILALDETGGDRASKCREMYESAHSLARQLGDKRATVQALLGMRWFTDFWPDLRDQVRQNAEEALSISREIGDEELVLESELATWRTGSRAEAKARGAHLFQRLKDRNELYRLNLFYFSMMWARLDWGEYEAAVETCDAGIRLAEEIGVPPVQYATLRARALLELGRFGEAWESLQQEVTDPEHPFGQAMQKLGIAEYHLELGEFEEAAAASRDLLPRAKALRRAWMTGLAYEILALALARERKLDSATWNEIQKEFRPVGREIRPEVSAEILLSEGKVDAAVLAAETAVAQARAGDEPADLVGASEVLGRALIEAGRPRDAMGPLEEASRMADEQRALLTGARLLALRGQAALALGEAASARQLLASARTTVQRVGDFIPEPARRARFLEGPWVASLLEGAG